MPMALALLSILSTYEVCYDWIDTMCHTITQLLDQFS